MLESPTATTEILGRELTVERLNDIHNWLWLVGRPVPPRPLYYQKSVRREIVVNEKMDMHLVWDDKRMFLKPIPKYLLDENFWADHLSCEDGCASMLKNQGNRQSGRGTRNTVEAFVCERCQMFECALGFMLSYASLISYESDLRFAKDANLVPIETTWPDWRLNVKRLVSLGKNRKVNQRYIYGELRLSRLNKIYRYTLRNPIHGYLYTYSSYNQFWHDNLARIASLFAYIAIVLTAMQVGLATDQLQGSSAFQRASYGFTIFSILAPLAIVGFILLIFIALFWSNLIRTLIYNRKRIAVIESSWGASTA